eukprot:365374-Chlamydomonas_euryale.AAC.10
MLEGTSCTFHSLLLRDRANDHTCAICQKPSGARSIAPEGHPVDEPLSSSKRLEHLCADVALLHHGHYW